MYGTRIWASTRSASQILVQPASVLVTSPIYITPCPCVHNGQIQPGEICNFYLKRDKSMVQPTDCLSRGSGHLEIAQSRDEQVEYKVWLYYFLVLVIPHQSTRHSDQDNHRVSARRVYWLHQIHRCRRCSSYGSSAFICIFILARVLELRCDGIQPTLPQRYRSTTRIL